MYKIIGADQKEYGPVSAEDLRQWIMDGRIDGRTPVRNDPDGQWRPLADYPEFHATLAASPSAHTLHASPGQASPAATTAEIIARDYDLDIGSCVTRSWSLLKQNFWPVIGVTTLVMIVNITITQCINLISSASTKEMIATMHFTPEGVGLMLLSTLLCAPVNFILMGGLYKYYLKLIRGEGAAVEDTFYGVTHAIVPLSVLGIINNLLVWVGIAFFILPGIFLAIAWVFSMPLLVDRQMGFWDAMQLSLKMVSKHWFTVFALLLVSGLVAACGVCALCIGVFITAPLAGLSMMYAYEDIFGRRSA